jgi:hypothetical protein
MNGIRRRLALWYDDGPLRAAPVPVWRPSCRHEGRPWCVVHDRLFVMQSRCDYFRDGDLGPLATPEPDGEAGSWTRALLLLGILAVGVAVLLAVDALWPERQTRPYDKWQRGLHPPEGDDGVDSMDPRLVAG